MKVFSKLLEMLVANHFQEVAPLDDSITSILIKNATLITFPEKERVITHGSICEHFFFDIAGSIRIERLTNLLMPPRMSCPVSSDRERHQILIEDQDRLIGETIAGIMGNKVSADQQQFIKMNQATGL